MLKWIIVCVVIIIMIEDEDFDMLDGEFLFVILYMCNLWWFYVIKEFLMSFFFNIIFY